MHQIKLLRPALPLAFLALAACSDPIGERTEDEYAATPVEPDGGIGDGAEPLAETLGTDIPRGLHGRWGLAPSDCSADNDRAEGLIVIDAEGIQFYESRAVVSEMEAKEATTISATFAFSGEGEEWTRDMQLSLSEDGTELIRSETGNDAVAEPLTYSKCDARGGDS